MQAAVHDLRQATGRRCKTPPGALPGGALAGRTDHQDALHAKVALPQAGCSDGLHPLAQPALVGTASGLGAALWWITPFQPLQAFFVALAITLMGFLGGLVMSAIKRDRGVKDWGSLIEGHGGMLDRLDSVCFSAPVFFHITRYWWTP